MAKHTWSNRITPPLVLAAVVGCVWYALQDRSSMQTAVAAPTKPTASNKPTTVPNTTQAQATVVPTVAKQSGQVQISVSTKTYKHVQKVEFYIEDSFVGAAYSEPYSVVVDENNLTAGDHTVTAKVYTDTDTTQTAPTTFTAAPTSTPVATDPSVAATTNTDGDTTTPPATPPADPNPILAAPSDIAVVASNNTTASLGWTDVDGALSYQVWRDGTQLGTTTDPSYTDNGLNQGQTYDYVVYAVDAAGNVSAASDTAVITMPTDPPAQQQVVITPPDPGTDDTSGQ